MNNIDYTDPALYPAVVRYTDGTSEMVFDHTEIPPGKPVMFAAVNVQLFDSKGIISTREQLEGR